jgi:hypothetical protein
MGELGSGRELEQLCRYTGTRTGAGTAVGDFIGIFFGIGDEFF